MFWTNTGAYVVIVVWTFVYGMMAEDHQINVHLPAHHRLSYTVVRFALQVVVVVILLCCHQYFVAVVRFSLLDNAVGL